MRAAGLVLPLGLWSCGGAPPEPAADPTPQAEDTAPAEGDQDTAVEPDPGTDGVVALCINELMPDNESALLAADGSSPDWVELHNPTDAVVSLAGWRLGDDPDDAPLLPEIDVPAGGYLLLYADGAPDRGEQHLPFSLSSEGEQLALYDPEGDGQIVSWGAVYADFSVARADDCCTGPDCWTHRFRGTPGGPNAADGRLDTVVVEGGATWAYWDRGLWPGSGWTDASFDDTGWATGAAPLGFGEDHIATALDGGPDGARYPAAWFRLAFEPVEADALQGSILVDDGAIVYLNGVEVLRTNLPDTGVTPTSWATSDLDGALETSWRAFELDPALLHPVRNVLAVEVHQSSATSSDLAMALSLTATRWVGR